MNDFVLKMTEEDGEIDEEFPPLDASKTVSIFGFTKLALIDKDDNSKGEESDDDTEGGASSFSDLNESTNPFMNKVTVLIHFTDGNPSQVLVFDSENTSMRKVFEEMCQIKANGVKIFCPCKRPRLFAFNFFVIRYALLTFYFKC